MITKKDLIVSVLCTFCLATVLFTMMPVQSAEWDPWLDVKEDGRINVLDLIKTASALGTMGDTTKNVTITGHAGKLAYSTATNVAPYSYLYSPWISVNGYSKITVCIHNIAIDNRYTLAASHSGGWGFYADTQVDFGEDLVKTYDVPNEQVQVQFSNQGSYDTSLYIDVYLIP